MRRFHLAFHGLCMIFGFALGASRGVVSLLPRETYYYMPQVMFLIAGLSIAGILWNGSKERKELAVLGLSLFSIAFCLSCAWTSLVQNALWTRWLVAGILPTNDARDFLDSALTLLGSGSFETPRGRPVSEAAWAGALALFGLDLFDAVFLFTALVALALAMACLTARSLIGTALAILLSACLFDYVHDHIGGVTSEIPGFILGLGAFALLTHAARTRSRAAAVGGAGLLAVAMVYRVGAMFILPALLYWAFRHLRERDRRPWLTIFSAVALLAMVFSVNGAVTNRITPTSGGNFVNAIDSWYATLVEGDLALSRRARDTVLPGTRWRQIYEDYPELKTLHGQEWVSKKLEVFARAASERPLSAVVGGAVELYGYLFKTDIFLFIDFKPLRYFVMLSWIIGVIACFMRRRDPVPGMMLWANIGILASQPFLYGGEYRTPAPTIAFTLMIAMYGIQAATGSVRGRARLSGLTSGWPTAWVSVAAVTVISLSVLGVAQRGRWSAPVSPSDHFPVRKAAFSLPSGSGLVIGSERERFPFAQSQPGFEESLRRLKSLLETRSRFRRVDFDDPYGSKSRWITRRISENPGIPFFAGTLLDRSTGKPVQVIIPDPRPHAAVQVYTLDSRDGVLVARPDSG